MSDEINQQLSDAIRQQTDMLGTLTTQIVVNNEINKKLAAAQGVNLKNIKNLDSSFDSLSRSTAKQSALAQAHAKAQEEHAKAMANFAAAASSTVVSLKSFGNALLDTDRNFKKYNGALNAAGDAALSLGKNFGVLGMALGGVVKGATMVAEAATKQADNTLKATDEIAKMGGAGTFTAKEFLQMGHSAGLTSKNLDLFTKAAKTIGGGMISLGGTVGDGTKAFAQLTAITTTQREAFQKLGISQEDLIQNQADFVSLQRQSGRLITERMKQDGSLQRASLAYTTNLLELAALTGQSVEEAKKNQQIARASFDIMLHTQKLEDQREAALARGDKIEADAIDKRIEQEGKMLDAAKATGDAQILAAVQSRIATGNYNESSAVLLRMGFEIEKVEQRIKEGGDGFTEFNKEFTRAMGETRKNIGDAAVQSKEVADQFGLSIQSMARARELQGKDQDKMLEDTRRRLGKPEEGKPGAVAATDPAQVARAKLTTLEIEASVALDKLLLKFNPLLSGFNDTTIAAIALAAAATAAATALTYMAGKAVLGKLSDMIGDVADAKKKGTTKSKPTPKARDPKTGRFVKSAGASAAKEVGALGKLAGVGSSVLGGAAKIAGPAGAAITAGMAVKGGYDEYQNVEKDVKEGLITKEEGTVKKSEAVGGAAGGAAGGAGGAWAGAAAGAALGSVVPVVGTMIGGILGAAVGGWLGSKGGEFIGNKVGKVAGEALKDTPPKPSTTTNTPTTPAVTEAAKTTASTTTTDTEKDKVATANIEKVLNNPENKDAQKDNTKAIASLDSNIITLNKTLITNIRSLNDLKVSIDDLSAYASLKDSTVSEDEKKRKLDEILARLGLLSKEQVGATPTAPGAGPSKPAAPTAPSGGGAAPAPSAPPKPSAPAGGGAAPAPSAPPKPSAPAGGGAAPQAGGPENEPAVAGGAPSTKPKLTKVTSKSGLGATVGERFAPAFQGLIDYLDKSGYEINSLGGYVDRDVRGKPGVKSVHAHGAAIDINPSTNPMGSTLITDLPKDISSVAAGLGLGWGGNWQSRKDAMHFSGAMSEGGSLLAARDGGVFNGPTSGYDVELHGREAIVPLPNPESVIKVEDSAEKQPLSTVTATSNVNQTKDISSEVLEQLFVMMEEKMDTMISKLSDSNDIQDKLLKYSQV